jgi:predicted RNase H-like HicB family nuclease
MTKSRMQTQPITEQDLETQIQALLRKPYKKVISGDADDGYLATAPELPGAITAGETEAEALEMLRDAMAGWFEARLMAGLLIPEPARERYSGRILVRCSPELHGQLADAAEEQHVSLNQFVTTILAAAVGLPRVSMTP